MFGRKRIKKADEKDPLISKEVPFAVEEAYKSLRTNLIFTLPEENCKIIEVTSSQQKEGKSITAVNLAISLCKNGSRVVLVDCDLRLPTVAKKLRIEQKPGLTNLLFGMNQMDEVINQHFSGVDVIPAGDLPPNPSEVLGSQNMKSAIEHLSQHYDYVILDTPPVGVVADAVILSQYASGIILVVRTGKTRQEDVGSAVDTLKLANANILGFVMTDTDERKQYYDKYGYTYKQKKG